MSVCTAIASAVAHINPCPFQPAGGCSKDATNPSRWSGFTASFTHSPAGRGRESGSPRTSCRGCPPNSSARERVRNTPFGRDPHSLLGWFRGNSPPPSPTTSPWGALPPVSPPPARLRWRAIGGTLSVAPFGPLLPSFDPLGLSLRSGTLPHLPQLRPSRLKEPLRAPDVHYSDINRPKGERSNLFCRLALGWSFK